MDTKTALRLLHESSYKGPIPDAPKYPLLTEEQMWQARLRARHHGAEMMLRAGKK